MTFHSFSPDDRALIYASGSDAAEFLQGQISNDVDLLTTQKSIHALILTPQGKILADLFVYSYQNGFLLDIHQSVKDWLLTRFQMFKLRSDVTFAEQDTNLFISITDQPQKGALISAADPRISGVYRNITTQPIKPNSAIEYQQYLASQAIIEFGTNYQASEHFPQDLWYDKLASVSFSKGCYVGQEVVSRMRHKSTARKRLLPLTSATSHQKGDKILLNQKSVGEVICKVENIYLAMMRVDKLTDDMTELDDFQIRRPQWIQNL